MQQAPCDIGQVKDISDNIYLRGAKPISALILLVSSMDRDSFAPPPLLAPTLPLLSSFSSRLEDFFEERSLSLRLSRDLERSLLSRWRSLERDLDLLRLLSRSLSRDLDLCLRRLSRDLSLSLFLFLSEGGSPRGASFISPSSSSSDSEAISSRSSSKIDTRGAI